jgi:hypothetical protein
MVSTRVTYGSRIHKNEIKTPKQKEVLDDIGGWEDNTEIGVK